MFSVGLVVRVTFHVNFEHLSIPVLLIDVELFVDILSRIIELGLGYLYRVIIGGQTCSYYCSYSCCACFPALLTQLLTVE